MRYCTLLLLTILFHSCTLKKPDYIDPTGNTIITRIKLPEGYTRHIWPDSTFAGFVQRTALLPHGSVVHHYDGSEKIAPGVYVAVINMDIGKKDLQQCADVCMHLRAAYLYKYRPHHTISFRLTSGFEAGYDKWMQGYRLSVSGNDVKWIKAVAPADNQAVFDAYMDAIYSYCGSLSLSRELQKIHYQDIEPGDLLVRGGTPGHVEMVMDVATNARGRKIYLLAQGFMPAQQMQLLANPTNDWISPWYKAEGYNILTPECPFTADHIMRFPGR